MSEKENQQCINYGVFEDWNTAELEITKLENRNKDLQAQLAAKDKVVAKLYIKLHGLEKCDFDDGCDSCGKPEGGIWAEIHHHPENVSEANYYICGKCISKKALQESEGKDE